MSKANWDQDLEGRNWGPSDADQTAGRKPAAAVAVGRVHGSHTAGIVAEEWD